MKRWIAYLSLSLLTPTLAACSGITFLAANLPARFERFEAVRDLAYGEDTRQRLDLYLPPPTRGASSSGLPPRTRRALPSGQAPRPVIVFFHGGRWSFGEKEQYEFVGAALAARGFIAVLPNYRLYPQARLAQFADDAARAVAWARAQAAQYGGDPRRVFVMGHSAGAHLAALIALDEQYLRHRGVQPGDIAGAIGLAGPYDFLPFSDDDIRDMFGPPERYAQSQPIEFARADAPPLLLLHGLRDDTVWVRNTRNLAAALQSAGAQVGVRYYDGVGHGDLVGALSLPLRRHAPVLDDIAAFVNGQASRGEAAR